MLNIIFEKKTKNFNKNGKFKFAKFRIFHERNQYFKCKTYKDRYLLNRLLKDLIKRNSFEYLLNYIF